MSSIRKITASQPQQVTGIDWSDSFSNGLSELIIPWTNTGIPVLSGVPLSVSGSISQKGSMTGIALDTLSASTYYYKNSASISSLNEFTIFGIITPGNTFNSSVGAFTCGNSTDSNPLFMLSQGSSGGFIACRIRDTAGTDIELQASDPQWVTGTSAMILITRSVLANTFNLWINGRIIAATTASSLAATTFDRTAIGCLLRSSAALNWNGNCTLAGYHNRALNPGEIAKFFSNPWKIFLGKRKFNSFAKSVSGNFFAILAESVASSDALLGFLATSQSLAESVAASDTLAAVASNSAALTENASASDSVSAVLAKFSSLAENVAASDTISSNLAGSGSLSESVTSTDTVSGSGSASATLTESISTSDAISAVISGLSAALSELASASDAISGISSASAALVESVAASETISAVTAGNYLASLIESASASDTVSALATLLSSLSEAVTASDLLSQVTSKSSALSEAVSASDTLSAITAGNYLGALAEAISASDIVSASVFKSSSLAELVSSTDSITALASGDYLAFLVEPVTLQDLVSKGFPAFQAVIIETVSAYDTLSIGPSRVFFYGNNEVFLIDLRSTVCNIDLRPTVWDIQRR